MHRHRPIGFLLASALLLGLAHGSLAQDIFTEKIVPILKASCYECHGPDKQKSELRLDSAEWIQKGSGGTPIIEPGKPDDSELFYRIDLPADDVDIMPPKGGPLPKEQIQLIRQWIEQGAPFGHPVADDTPAETATPGATPPADILDELASQVSPASADTLAALEGLAAPIAQNSPLIRLDFQFYDGELNNEVRGHLRELSRQVTWVNLRGTDFGDEDMHHLADFPHLTQLHLETTNVGDAGLVHLSGLQYLEYLNLYGTKVTDAGLAHLTGLPRLKKLYLWQTGVTAAGAAKLKASLPGLYINLGAEELIAEASLAPAFDLAGYFDAGACCTTTHTTGTACDHPCCQAAAKLGQICLKCNPGAEKMLLSLARGAVAALPAPEKRLDVLSLLFDEGSCCAQAHARGEDCAMPCCTKARLLGTVCTSCNPGAEKKLGELEH